MSSSASSKAREREREPAHSPDPKETHRVFRETKGEGRADGTRKRESRHIQRGVEKFNITIPTVGSTGGYEDSGGRGDGVGGGEG